MADILRLAEPSRLISAAVFDEIFDFNHARWFDCTRQSHVSFFNDVLGSIKKPYSWQKALEGFNQATAGYDFICPGFQMTLMIPLLLHLRNQAGSDVRLLFINHSPGVCPLLSGPGMSLLRLAGALLA